MPEIRLVHPATPMPPEQWAEEVKIWNQFGFVFTQGTVPLTPCGYLAGTVEQRAEELKQAFSDPKVQIILAQKGGCGSATFLDKLDYEYLCHHKKMFFGMSDITALQNALWACAKLKTGTGLIGKFLGNPEQQVHELLSILNHQKITYVAKQSGGGNSVKGPLIGGNLMTFTALLGTPYFPDVQNAVLLLEEVGEPPYKIDRALNQLRLAGVFDKVAGIVLGSWYHCEYKGTQVEPVLERYFAPLNKPVLWHIPYGHSPEDYAILPVGGKVVINPPKKTICYSATELC